MVCYVLVLGCIILGYFGTALIAWQSIGRKNWLTFLALAFIIAGAFGAVWVVISSNQTSDELFKKSKEISALNRLTIEKTNEIELLSRKLSEKSEEIALYQVELRRKAEGTIRLYKEISSKSDQIATLNRDIAGSVTGGDSYCSFNVILGTNTFYLLFDVKGKHPVYDIDIRIDNPTSERNMRTLEKVATLTTADDFLRAWAFQDGELTLHIGNLPAPSPEINGTSISWGRTVGPFRLDDSRPQKYIVQVVARNGTITGQILFYKLDGRWQYATRTERRGSIVDQKVTEGFPLNERGEVDWYFR